MKKIIISIDYNARKINYLEGQVASETTVLQLLLSDPDDERLLFSLAQVKAEKSENLKVLPMKIFYDDENKHHGYQQDVEKYYKIQEEYIEILKKEVEEKKEKARNLTESRIILPFSF